MIRDTVVQTLASTTPAAGAEISQVIIATAGGMALSFGVLALVVGHRSGRLKIVGRAAALAEREAGVAGWAALPGALLGAALLTAVFGMYWDISLHLDNGRDPGPLANPAHYFILIGLFGVLFAGVAAIALPLKRPDAAAVRLPNGWWAPLGGLLIAICGSVSLLAFPLDDIWHRLFGQDVTLWGPTHLLLIGGASFSIIGAWILHVEGESTRTRSGKARQRARAREFILAGSFLVGLSTFQAEFDFAVPQFRLVCHPILLMLAAGIGLVVARVRLGRGGALGAVAVFLVIRGVLALLVGPIFGQTTPHFPLYIVEAGLVELIALRFAARERPIAFGALAGLAIGTVGLAAEWGWSHVWWVIPWPSSLFPEGAIAGFVAAVAGGVIGGWIGRSLLSERPPETAPRWTVPAAAVAAVGVLAFMLPMPNPAHPPRATLALTDLHGAPKRTVAATIRLEPRDAARDARWLNVTAWQGSGSVVDPLKQIGEGVYRTTKPIPVYGNWKVTVRLHKGAAVMGLPVYFPNDPAIPVGATPAQANINRAFVRDKKNLQREQKSGVPGILTGLAYAAVLVIWLGMLAALAWGLARLARMRRGAGGPPAPSPEAERAPAPRRWARRGRVDDTPRAPLRHAERMSLLRALGGGRDLAIDLGTANTLVFVHGEGILVDEPSVVAVDETGEVYAVGSEAERMLGRTPATISAQRPLKDGVIADFEVTEQMLRHFIRRVLPSRRARARLIVCAPSGITEVEARAVVEASMAAGAREVELIEEPIAAALGAGLDISEPSGVMVIDVGGGTSEVAVLSMGGIVVSTSMRVGGYTLDEAIVDFVKNEHRLAVGARTAEEVKLRIGTAYPVEEETTTEIRGRDMISGLPTKLELTSDEVRAALAPTLTTTVNGVKETLDRTPPELASDISAHGIVLAGGGSLLRGFGELLRAETGMPVYLADDPLTCVVRGAGEALAEFGASARASKRRSQLGLRQSRMAGSAGSP